MGEWHHSNSHLGRTSFPTPSTLRAIELASRLVCFALCRAIWKFGDGPGSQKKTSQSCRRRLLFTGNGSEGKREEMFGANRNEERAFVGILGLLRLKTKMGYLKITRKNSSHVSNNLFVIQVSLVQAPTSRWTTTQAFVSVKPWGKWDQILSHKTPQASTNPRCLCCFLHHPNNLCHDLEGLHALCGQSEFGLDRSVDPWNHGVGSSFPGGKHLPAN